MDPDKPVESALDATDDYEEDDKDEISPSAAMTPLELTPRLPDIDDNMISSDVSKYSDRNNYIIFYTYLPLLFPFLPSLSSYHNFLFVCHHLRPS